MRKLHGSALVLADALFDQDAAVPLLRDNDFAGRFNMASHGLNDHALNRLVTDLLARKVFRLRGRSESDLGRPDIIGLSPRGGAEWEQARHPNWDSYVTDSMFERRGRWHIEVTSRSPDAVRSYLVAARAA